MKKFYLLDVLPFYSALALALVKSGTAFDFRNAFKEYNPTVLYYESTKGDNCTELFCETDVRPYNSVFSCKGKKEGVEVCACVKGHTAKAVNKENDPNGFINYCGTCKMGIVPIAEHYNAFQTLTSWQDLLMFLSNVDEGNYIKLFGPYRTMVLPADVNEELGAFRWVVDDLKQVFDVLPKDEQATAYVSFITGLMARMAPYAQEATNFLKPLSSSVSKSLKEKCENILMYWKALVMANVDGLSCMKDGTLKGYNSKPVSGLNDPEQCSTLEESCEALYKESMYFGTIGAERPEAAAFTCLLRAAWE